MKVTFLTPPALEGKLAADRVFGCNYGYYPMPNIFILYSAALLEEKGFLVRYVDGDMEGWSAKQLEDFLKKDDSHVYCFYTVYLARKTDLIAVEKIRRIRGRITIVFCGPVPTENPTSFLKDEDIIVVRGEPELTIMELMRTLKDNGRLESIDGISFRKDGQVVNNGPREVNGDLDSLPLPARHLVDKYKYYNPKLGVKPFTAVLTSRGCCYKCIYCVPCSLSFARELEHKAYSSKKPPVRLRSPENVIKEFRHLKQEGYRGVSIIDDQFIWGEKRTLEICKGIRDAGIEWTCLARADHMTDQIARALSESNCKCVDIGVESFNQEVLNYIKKDLKLETVYNAIDTLNKYDVPVKINVLIGASPLETRETILKNIEIVNSLKVDSVMYGICNPFPGTEFEKIARQEGWLLYDEYKAVDVQKEAIISYPHLSNKDIEALARKANLSFFLRPTFFSRNIKRIKGFGSLLEAASSLKRKLFD